MPSLARSARFLLATALLVHPGVARAHTGLLRSDPSKGARLAQPPARITLWFTERPELAFSNVHLFGPAAEIRLSTLVADSGDALHVEISQRLEPGEYRVEWQAAGADGHPARGAFTFVVAGEAAAATTTIHASAIASPHTADPAALASNGTQRTARWLEFIALLAIVGAFGFQHGVLPSLAVRGVSTADAAARARRLARGAVLLYLMAALARAYDESVVIHGASRALVMEQLRPMLTETLWGAGWCAGVVGALLIIAGWWLSRRNVSAGAPIALLGAIAMIVSPGFSGHAASSRLMPLALALDALHVAAAGVWLGGLFHVTFAGIPAMQRLPAAERDGAVATLVNSFHPVALFCAPIVVLTGLGSSWLRLGNLDALTSTEYGLNLIWKVVMVAFVAIIGAFNWLRVRPRLGTGPSTRRMRWVASAELFFATMVLAVTAALVMNAVPSQMVGR